MIARRSKRIFNATVGALAVGIFKAIRFADRRRSANLAGAALRRIGPLRKEHRVGRENLHAAFPEKSAAEIEQILAGVWDNLGRVAVEFAHLDEFRLPDSAPPTSDTILLSPETLERAECIRRNGKPLIGFGAHLANWELPAVLVKMAGFDSAALYRRPNIAAISDLIGRLRTPLMGRLVPSGLAAPIRLARLVEAGVNVGMLADQHDARGVVVNFFGRPCLTNPLIAILARQTEAPIHGLRMVRQPDGNSFWGEITEPVALARDAEGGVDIKGTMQSITAVIEGWVREHPEQWLWLHRRWR